MKSGNELFEQFCVNEFLPSLMFVEGIYDNFVRIQNRIPDVLKRLVSLGNNLSSSVSETPSAKCTGA